MPNERKSNNIGILAYGSLISDPGDEIGPLIVRRVSTETPFPVEYARFSTSRGGAPTIVPHSSGWPVRAEVLVLRDTLSLDDAKNLLWRRETRREGIYKERSAPNAVLVQDMPGFLDLEHVLYTDFHSTGKTETPEPTKLAEAAVSSVAEAPLDKDGISYLMDLMACGVETALTASYQKEILALTGKPSLPEALESARATKHAGKPDGTD